MIQLNINDAARYTGTTKQKIEEAIKRSDLPATKDGKKWLISLEDLETWDTAQFMNGEL